MSGIYNYIQYTCIILVHVSYGSFFGTCVVYSNVNIIYLLFNYNMSSRNCVFMCIFLYCVEFFFNELILSVILF